MKSLIRPALAGLAAVAALSAMPAAAKNVTADLDQIAGLLRKAGYTIEQKGEKGDRYLSVDNDGPVSLIIPYGCDDRGRKCKSVQFYTGFSPKQKPTLEAMNAYARENRWGRIYLDKDNDPAIELDVDLEQGGMSEELFLDNVAYWNTIAANFSEFVFGKQKAEQAPPADETKE